jgi:hypothetical protein
MCRVQLVAFIYRTEMRKKMGKDPDCATHVGSALGLTLLGLTVAVASLLYPHLGEAFGNNFECKFDLVLIAFLYSAIVITIILFMLIRYAYTTYISAPKS